MKLFLLVALIGAAVANHVPGHLEHPYILARHADAASELPTVLTESIMDQPVVVVTRTTRLAPELVAILVEQGINNMPESLESFHDVVRSAEAEEFTLCNGGLSGAVEYCVEKPITKLLVPETYKDLTVTRLMSEMPAMPWVRMPFLTRSIVPSTLADMEVFDKPILITRAVPVATAAVAPHEIVADSIPLRSLYNAPLSNMYSKYFIDGSVLKSYNPFARSFLPTGSPLVKSAYLPKFEDTIIDSEVAKPLEYYTSNIYSPSHFKSLNKFDLVRNNKFDLVRNIKPVIKSYDTVIEKPFLKNYITKPYYRNYDDIVAKPVFKNYDQVIAKPFYKSYDDVITPSVLKNYDDIIEKPTFKVYGDDILAKPFLKDYANVHPFYKSFHLVDTPASVLPVTKSSSFLLPKASYETLY